MKYRVISVLLILLTISSELSSQNGDQGVSKYGTNKYIELIQGNMPLVISIPHGGYQMPDEIPERPCTTCAKHQDMFTLEIGLAIRNNLYQQTGLYPYLIINHLHRTRLDPNRNVTEAADGNDLAEAAWVEFQTFIDSACIEIEDTYGKGLYIDLHGHRHTKKVTELGYLLGGDELRLDDDLLNDRTFVEYSSIRNLVDENINLYSFIDLIRGPHSLGSMLEEMGYPTVPSMNHPFPEIGEPFFSGGYNTARHGSVSEGMIDGIQIELDEDLRLDKNSRDKFAEDISFILVNFLKTHYFPDLLSFVILSETKNPGCH